MSALAFRRRSGFTLTELLVALILFSILGGAILKVLTSQQRSYNAQLARTSLQQNIRAAAAILPNELREIDAVEGDIIAMSDTVLTIHQMRQFGIVCNPPTLGGALAGLATTLRGPLYSSSRNFVVGDSLYIWYEGNSSVRTDDGWMVGKVTAVSTGACPTLPAAGNSDIKLTLTLALGAGQTNTAGYIPTGSPVRGYETRTYRLYKYTDNRYYLGVAINGAATQPLLGPITSNGLTFVYRDGTAANAVTAVRTSVARIDVTLRAETKNPIYTSGGSLATASDSVAFSVYLRNNPRY